MTKPVRSAGLVEESPNEKVLTTERTSLFAFDGVLLAVDRVPMGDRAELVALAATRSTHPASYIRIHHSGSTGYRAQMTVAEDAGFVEGDSLHCHAAGVLLMAPLDGDAPTRELIDYRHNRHIMSEAYEALLDVFADIRARSAANSWLSRVVRQGAKT